MLDYNLGDHPTALFVLERVAREIQFAQWQFLGVRQRWHQQFELLWVLNAEVDS